MRIGIHGIEVFEFKNLIAYSEKVYHQFCNFLNGKDGEWHDV